MNSNGLPGLNQTASTPQPKTAVTVSDPTAETHVASDTFDIVIPANTLTKGRTVTVEGGSTPNTTRIPAEKMSDPTVSNRTLMLYFSIDFIGGDLPAGITNAGFTNPSAATFPNGTSAVLMLYDTSSKSWVNTGTTFLSNGSSLLLSSGSITRSGAYCLFTATTSDPVATPNPTPTPTPISTPSPTPSTADLGVASVRITTVGDPVIAPPPSTIGATPMIPSTLQLTAAVTMNSNSATPAPVTWSITPPIDGVSVSGSGLVSAGSTAAEGNVVISALAGDKTATTSIYIYTAGEGDVSISERRNSK